MQYTPKIFNGGVNIKYHNWCKEKLIIYDRACTSVPKKVAKNVSREVG